MENARAGKKASDTTSRPSAEAAGGNSASLFLAQPAARGRLVWQNSAQKICKIIGPATRCACDHFFKQHLAKRKSQSVGCSEAGCACRAFLYVPVHGSADFKCRCKHSFRDHAPSSRKCSRCPCAKLSSAFSCICGEQFDTHSMAIDESFIPTTQGGYMPFESFTDLIGYGDSFAARIDAYNVLAGQGVVDDRTKDALMSGEKITASEQPYLSGSTPKVDLAALAHTPHIY